MGLLSMYYCAPTYTACGIETSFSMFLSIDLNCAPTYTACGIETTFLEGIKVSSPLCIVHPLIPLAVLKHELISHWSEWLNVIVHPLIPLAVLKLRFPLLDDSHNAIQDCAPTYTACGMINDTDL